MNAADEAGNDVRLSKDAAPRRKNARGYASAKENDIQALLAMNPSQLNSKQRRQLRRHGERHDGKANARATAVAPAATASRREEGNNARSAAVTISKGATANAGSRFVKITAAVARQQPRQQKRPASSTATKKPSLALERPPAVLHVVKAKPNAAAATAASAAAPWKTSAARPVYGKATSHPASNIKLQALGSMSKKRKLLPPNQPERSWQGRIQSRWNKAATAAAAAKVTQQLKNQKKNSPAGAKAATTGAATQQSKKQKINYPTGPKTATLAAATQQRKKQKKNHPPGPKAAAAATQQSKTKKKNYPTDPTSRTAAAATQQSKKKKKNPFGGSKAAAASAAAAPTIQRNTQKNNAPEVGSKTMKTAAAAATPKSQKAKLPKWQSQKQILEHIRSTKEKNANKQKQMRKRPSLPAPMAALEKKKKKNNSSAVSEARAASAAKGKTLGGDAKVNIPLKANEDDGMSISDPSGDSFRLKRDKSLPLQKTPEGIVLNDSPVGEGNVLGAEGKFRDEQSGGDTSFLDEHASERLVGGEAPVAMGSLPRREEGGAPRDENAQEAIVLDSNSSPDWEDEGAREENPRDDGGEKIRAAEDEARDEHVARLKEEEAVATAIERDLFDMADWAIMIAARRSGKISSYFSDLRQAPSADLQRKERHLQHQWGNREGKRVLVDIGCKKNANKNNGIGGIGDCEFRFNPLDDVVQDSNGNGEALSNADEDKESDGRDNDIVTNHDKDRISMNMVDIEESFEAEDLQMGLSECGKNESLGMFSASTSLDKCKHNNQNPRNNEHRLETLPERSENAPPPSLPSHCVSTRQNQAEVNYLAHLEANRTSDTAVQDRALERSGVPRLSTFQADRVVNKRSRNDQSATGQAGCHRREEHFEDRQRTERWQQYQNGDGEGFADERARNDPSLNGQATRQRRQEANSGDSARGLGERVDRYATNATRHLVRYPRIEDSQPNADADGGAFLQPSGNKSMEMTDADGSSDSESLKLGSGCNVPFVPSIDDGSGNVSTSRCDEAVSNTDRDDLHHNGKGLNSIFFSFPLVTVIVCLLFLLSLPWELMQSKLYHAGITRKTWNKEYVCCLGAKCLQFRTSLLFTNVEFQSG